MIRSGFWDDPKMGRLSRSARLLYAGTWNLADDVGHVRIEPAFLRTNLFAYDDDLTLADLEKWLTELTDLARLVPYQVEGERYAQIPKFLVHQKIDRPSKWRWPPPCDAQTCANGEGSTHARDTLDAHSASRVREVEVEVEVEALTAPSPASQDDDGFEEFWTTYPDRNGKKLAKAKALLIWRRMSKTKRTQALLGAGHYRASGELPKDAHRWLRDQDWTDWQTPAAPQAAPMRNGSVTSNGNHPPVSMAGSTRRGWNPRDGEQEAW